jgi:hypothetical protein
MLYFGMTKFEFILCYCRKKEIKPNKEFIIFFFIHTNFYAVYDFHVPRNISSNFNIVYTVYHGYV